MKEFLEVKFTGWTATPRLPFVLSGNAICMPTPSYSILLGVIGCCLGRIVEANEVDIGFYYKYDTTENDLETRHRLAFSGKLKPHAKGTDAYNREFHINPVLTIWINRTDWLEYFKYPIGTPSLGRSQDLLQIQSANIVQVQSIEKGMISGCMLPFSMDLKVGGQLIQIAEAYQENAEIGTGRTAINSQIFVSIPWDNNSAVECDSLYETDKEKEKDRRQFYLHTW
jgi:CRISPR-associated protein Cas5t